MSRRKITTRLNVFLNRRVNRLYYDYESDWLTWSREPRGTFPPFEQWLSDLGYEKEAQYAAQQKGS